MKKLIPSALAFLLIMTGSLLGAVSWTPGWTGLTDGPGGAAVSPGELERTRILGDSVDSAESVRRAIEAWETIARAQPTEIDAWVEIGCLRLLEGAAYRTRGKDRLVCYIEGLRACERAMATNPRFLQRVRAGATVWEASAELGEREMAAMHFWSTGVFYIFRDCLGLFGRMANGRLMRGAKNLLERMDSIDASWEEYTTTFSWGIFYLAAPKSWGGDKVKARAVFEQAVAKGVNRTAPRWGRGKYFFVAVGETAAARADLQMVATRELEGLGGSRAWNRYFKAEAAELLKKLR